MLRSLNKLLGTTIVATDGEIGSVTNFLFEDVSWRIAYLVTETGAWFNRHQVLLAPNVIGRPDWNARVFPVFLTKDQVKNSPPVDADKPVSRQQETLLNQYYGWPSYWDLPTEPLEIAERGDPHLRGCREMAGYRVLGGGEELGAVEDFIVDDQTWRIRYLLAESGAEHGGHVLLLPTDHAGDISWTYRRLEWNRPVSL